MKATVYLAYITVYPIPFLIFVYIKTYRDKANDKLKMMKNHDL